MITSQICVLLPAPCTFIIVIVHFKAKAPLFAYTHTLECYATKRPLLFSDPQIVIEDAKALIEPTLCVSLSLSLSFRYLCEVIKIEEFLRSLIVEKSGEHAMSILSAVIDYSRMDHKKLHF
jgi:hypothetical protein